MSLDSPLPMDGPGDFADAAAELARDLRWGYAIPTSVLAAALAHLAWAGLIVSVAEHELICTSYAERLRQVEQAADELVRQIHSGE